jgi:hypothetical protein
LSHISGHLCINLFVRQGLKLAWGWPHIQSSYLHLLHNWDYWSALPYPVLLVGIYIFSKPK